MADNKDNKDELDIDFSLNKDDLEESNESDESISTSTNKQEKIELGDSNSEKFENICSVELPNSFLRTVRDTLEKEGVFSNHEDDPGGKTKFGITEKLARSLGYNGEMINLSKDQSLHIYHEVFWNDYLHEIYKEFYPIAHEIFDTSVNMGQKDAVKFLQRALNAFNNKGKIYKDITKDGVMGDKTLNAFMEYKEHRGDTGCKVLLSVLNSLQTVEYFELSEKDEKFESFTYGWVSKRSMIEV